MNFFPYQHAHLVGIKGVAMTALAQLLRDCGTSVTGSDVAEEFVTQKMLTQLHLKIQISFADKLPDKTDCVIYTAAHQAINNPQVQAALTKKLPVFSHAEVLALFFNQKHGIAVCGVGGKSTISAMIAWILTKLRQNPSYAVGVGKIIGLKQTGKYAKSSKIFVAEADEYVTNPTEPNPQLRVARFSYLRPSIAICSNILHDHPDVYANEAATQTVFNQFFGQIKKPRVLILNSASEKLLTTKVAKLITYGVNAHDTYFLEKNSETRDKVVTTTLHYKNTTYKVSLAVPGFFNLLNATAAIAACVAAGLPIAECIEAIRTFASTQRRFENKGIHNGVQYYDDYAHHPSEILATITAAKDWEPNKRIVFAFQPHTYSRTKKLFSEFSEVLSRANEMLLLPIYASAREQADTSIQSEMLLPSAKSLSGIAELAEWCKKELKPGDVFITLGAGDIYQVHELLQ